MYTYIEFISFDPGDYRTRIRRTFGKFSGWRVGGPIGARYALFRNKRSEIFIPEYCLTKETRSKIGEARP